ncbi:hypothetical protein D9619_012279 [Psilocybe cf. subviscida]|uniref:Uncharacterized protein n=1 Tax=Psilocybe cf. subviscida TaxID=2480587 RepID=A0A8H5B834_9AGAR|nr:hypothetical protein D9619_012279 [Psilocybe cf. subviscida]
MSQSPRVPLPSIALVLTTDHARIPRRSSVIKFAANPAPAAKVYSSQDLMKDTDTRHVDGRFTDEDTVQGSRREHTATSSVDDEEAKDLAESVDGTLLDDKQERFIVVKLIKEKISNLLFSFRRLLCADRPQTCFPGVTRQ